MLKPEQHLGNIYLHQWRSNRAAAS